MSGWFHLSVKAVSRSAGRSVTAAAAYRLGMRIEDQREAIVFDYRARSGVEAAFTVAPAHAPDWAHDPERLWNAADQAETRKNSTLAREYELALPAHVTPEARREIVEQFARHLVDRYGVAISVAIHAPSKDGDQRNFHAHVLTTTRRMEAEGLGAKTRILDDRKTGPEEVKHLREHACTLINEALRLAGSDERVTHLSFAARKIDQEPTIHLGPSASEMERRGEGSDRGDINREIKAKNSAWAEMVEIGRQIAQEAARLMGLTSPTREEIADRMRLEMEPYAEQIRTQGHITDIRRDGLTVWERMGMEAHRARRWARDAFDHAHDRWRSFTRRHDERDREQDFDHER